MYPTVFELEIPDSERPQGSALDRGANGIGSVRLLLGTWLFKNIEFAKIGCDCWK
jgi:hypothetical protein